MGYTTDFNGRFDLDKRLDDETFDFLNKLARTRRVKRKIEGFGVEGEFFVDGDGFMGQDHDDTIIDGNQPPSTQPSLWCQWVPTEDHMGIEWDGGEKFYHYVDWIEYIISKVLAPKGYTLNGEVGYQGEDLDDFGIIGIIYNAVQNIQGQRTYIEPTPAPVKKPRKKRVSKPKTVSEPLHHVRKLNMA